MEYEGKLYGKVGGEYLPMIETTKDINRYKQRIKELEEQVSNTNLLHGVSKTLPSDAIIKSGELNGVDFIDEDIKDWEESDIETFEEYLEKYY